VADDTGQIVASHLVKKFHGINAVADLTFAVEPGVITGFLGPNGAGKTTTLRMLLALVTPDAGTATISGRSYQALPAPGRAAGAVLETGGQGGSHLGWSKYRDFFSPVDLKMFAGGGDLLLIAIGVWVHVKIILRQSQSSACSNRRMIAQQKVVGQDSH